MSYVNKVELSQYVQKNNVGAMYGAALALVILQQPDQARSKLKNLNNITWNMEVHHFAVTLH